MQLARIAVLCSLAACAAAGAPIGNTGDDDDLPGDAMREPDARQAASDAPMPIVDAPPMIDAFVFLDAPADAASALFCSANSQAGECCIRLGGPMGFCGTGIPIGDECLPQ
jgi:hypothetical protein